MSHHIDAISNESAVDDATSNAFSAEEHSVSYLLNALMAKPIYIRSGKISSLRPGGFGVGRSKYSRETKQSLKSKKRASVISDVASSALPYPQGSCLSLAVARGSTWHRQITES